MEHDLNGTSFQCNTNTSVNVGLINNSKADAVLLVRISRVALISVIVSMCLCA